MQDLPENTSNTPALFHPQIRLDNRSPQVTDIHTGENFLRISVKDERALDDSPICFGHFSANDPICKDCNFRIRCGHVGDNTG